MSYLVLTQASSGATRNAGTDGDLCGLFDWALLQKNWAIEFTATGERIYRSNVGHRFRYQVIHKAATSGAAQRALVRGAESASSTTSLTDPFPLTSQVADNACNFLVSSTADTTARNFIIIVDDVSLFYASKFNGTSWDWGFFGTPGGVESGDSYGSLVHQRNSTSNTVSSAIEATTSNVLGGNLNTLWCRDRSGATKSPRGCFRGPGANALGSVIGCPAARAGFSNRVRREKIAVDCSGAQNGTPNSMAVDRRGWMPHLWQGLHNGIGTLADGNQMGDSAYDALAEFLVIRGSSSAWALVETTATWAPPSG